MSEVIQASIITGVFVLSGVIISFTFQYLFNKSKDKRDLEISNKKDRLEFLIREIKDEKNSKEFRLRAYREYKELGGNGLYDEKYIEENLS